MEVIVAFVDDHRDELGVEPICRALQIAPSTYYAAKRRQFAPSARAVRDAAMMQVLMVLWVREPQGLRRPQTVEGGAPRRAWHRP